MTAAFTLHGALRRAADATPDALALAEPESSLTYAELESYSAGQAARLHEMGVRPGDRVAVAAAKSVRSVAALYAIMRLGAAYVPIDPLAPPRRVAAVLADAECRALCGDRQRFDRLAAVLDECALPTFDLGETVDGRAEQPGRGCESDLAYILYTSGSTGKPKGVMLTHRNALAFVEWAAARFGLAPNDRLVSHAPFHFDLSVFDLYAAALVGASVHLLAPGEEAFGASLAAAVRDRRLTVWYSVPSALVLLAAAARAAELASLRVVLFAGEVFQMKHLRRLRELVPDAVLGNLYGPTETNVCTYHRVDGPLPPGDKPLPIGRACENQEVFALDEAMRPVAEGAVGELWVRGPTVMQGYWGDAAQTERSLRQNPLHNSYPDRAYRTGDLVRVLPGGEYEFLGRRDHQVKSRGYRIELGDIETVLAASEGVREAAVVAVPDERLGSRLVAFAGCTAAVGPDVLKRQCAMSLPRYMVPSAIVVEPELPRTSTGKIDRQALSKRAAAL